MGNRAYSKGAESVTSLQERNDKIIDLVNSGIKTKDVANRFGLSPNTVREIVSRGDSYLSTGYSSTARSEKPQDTNNTLDLIRNKHPYNKGDKVHVKDDNGKYISATVKQRTGILFVLVCGDGLTRTVSFPDLAMDKELIKG